MWLIWIIVMWTALALIPAWLFARLFLTGEDLSRYDYPLHEPKIRDTGSTQERLEVLELIAEMRRRTKAAPLTGRLAAARALANLGFAGTPSDPATLGVDVREVDAGGVPAEWVIAPGADPDRRLLYIHGGALTLGSPASHRAITSALSRRAGLVVLAIDYRLMPENRRFASVADCRGAYRWLIENAPTGCGSPRDLYVAGDSAGGNLTLALLAWVRDTGLRAPDAAVAMSPATDNTFQSPSLRANIATDVLLGPALGRFMRLPRAALAWMTWLTTGLRPQHPILSPLRAALSDLPPTLVQASTSEMLRDDSRRYVNKAVSEGSPAELELWPDMVHVWQLFEHVLPESGQALDRIAEFLNEHRNERAA